MFIVTGCFDAAIERFLATPMMPKQRLKVIERLPVSLVASVAHNVEEHTIEPGRIQAN